MIATRPGRHVSAWRSTSPLTSRTCLGDDLHEISIGIAQERIPVVAAVCAVAAPHAPPRPPVPQGAIGRSKEVTDAGQRGELLDADHESRRAYVGVPALRSGQRQIEAMVGHPGGVGLSEGCPSCQGLDGDRELGRVLAWENDVWRVPIRLKAPVVGFDYLEPKRHIPHITDLDGVEATTLGPILARITRILLEETGAELIYVNVFGERVPHLHFNLAPHRTGDPLAGGPGMIIGEPPPRPEHTLRKIASQLARRLRD